MMVVAWPVTVVTRVLSCGVVLVLEDEDVVEGEDELDCEDYELSVLHIKTLNPSARPGSRASKSKTQKTLERLVYKKRVGHTDSSVVLELDGTAIVENDDLVL